MGHGGGDQYGYARETLDEAYMAKQLSRLWDHSGTASVEEVTNLKTENQQLRERLGALERRIEALPMPVYAWTAKR